MSTWTWSQAALFECVVFLLCCVALLAAGALDERRRRRAQRNARRPVAQASRWRV
jgi:hypothetical protein